MAADAVTDNGGTDQQARRSCPVPAAKGSETVIFLDPYYYQFQGCTCMPGYIANMVYGDDGAVTDFRCEPKTAHKVCVDSRMGRTWPDGGQIHFTAYPVQPGRGSGIEPMLDGNPSRSVLMLGSDCSCSSCQPSPMLLFCAQRVDIKTLTNVCGTVGFVLIVGLAIYLYLRWRGKFATDALDAKKKRARPPQQGQPLTLVLTDVAGSTALWEWDTAQAAQVISLAQSHCSVTCRP